MQRRSFLKITGASAMAVVIAPSLITQRLYAEDGLSLYESYEKVQLKDAEGNPLKASALTVEENYVFNFPHIATPCILVDLGRPANTNVKLKADDGTEYIFKGGLGKNNSIVAYSAICPHQMTHPTPDDSFFQYLERKGKTLALPKAEEAGVFVCSSHLSAFDPVNGGKAIAGPATEGLTQIVLEIDDNDEIWAVGALGPNRFHDYMDAFKPEFKKYYKNKRKAKRLVKDEAKVVTLKHFSKDIIQY
ncbi:Rieske 2Fe-2S domain-containing protein [Sulfurovum mangrovi]|uniref:Rieske 2Fe-2S domain-containing protein n=1 Tax=Sulfurovum mangrovi TaxID=2893889 RepID=UPI001E408CEA|nr:Rieske 2Fe-2S domain-containing protein [Sulfurovum mangrovi]UFH60037.1 Rieske 2Fe-2S domain-containing protein [Sulfurovum mangrovi]